MQIINAMDYGFRKVIRVCLNPDEPECVHPDGSPHTGNPDPSEEGVSVPTNWAELRPWEWCHACRYNWQVREFVWTGDELYYLNAAGQRHQKEDSKLLREITLALTEGPSITPEPMVALIDRSL